MRAPFGQLVPRLLLVAAALCLGAACAVFGLLSAAGGAGASTVGSRFGAIALLAPLFLAGALGLGGVVLLALYFIASVWGSSPWDPPPPDTAGRTAPRAGRALA